MSRSAISVSLAQAWLRGFFNVTIRYTPLAMALIAVGLILCLTLLPRDHAIAQQAPDKAASDAVWNAAHRGPLPADLQVTPQSDPKLTSDLAALHAPDS